MEQRAKQVIDFRASKGVSSGESNEELRQWTENGWKQAVSNGNYDRSREHLNFEIVKGGRIAPVDKEYSLQARMADNLAARGIKDPNEGLEEPKYRTVVNFIFGGSTDRMRELAFGSQMVDYESKSGNEEVKRMPEIEQWAKDIYDFVAAKYGEQNILDFIVHLDEKNPHIHCSVLPIDENNKFAFKKLFAGKDKYEFKRNTLKLHDDLAKVNEKWGLYRGSCITETGARHRSTEEYRRWLDNECVTLEDRRDNLKKALEELNAELAVAEKKQKSFTTMIANLEKEKTQLDEELRPLREQQQNSQAISAEIAQKIQHIEEQKAKVEQKLAERQSQLAKTEQEIDRLRDEKADLEREANELSEKARSSEQDWAHNTSQVLNTAVMNTLAGEYISRFPKMPDEMKNLFDGTLLNELAEGGTHVMKVALSLMCGFIDDATTVAQTHGGGGGGPKGGWGKKDDEDDLAFARRSLAMARSMCKPVGKRKRL